MTEQLEGIASLVGEQGVFLTKAGQPGPVLADLNAMFTLSLIYDVDLALTDFDLGYEVDLVAIAANALKHEADHRPACARTIDGRRAQYFHVGNLGSAVGIYGAGHQEEGAELPLLWT